LRRSQIGRVFEETEDEPEGQRIVEGVRLSGLKG
jgi:hypothetical protein